MEVPWDTEHVVSAATRRQRQMAWVPAVGMRVIPQRERESTRGGEKERVWGREEEREEQNAAEKGVCGVRCFSSNLWFQRKEAADLEEIFGNMSGAR